MFKTTRTTIIIQIQRHTHAHVERNYIDISWKLHNPLFHHCSTGCLNCQTSSSIHHLIPNVHYISFSSIQRIHITLLIYLYLSYLYLHTYVFSILIFSAMILNFLQPSAFHVQLWSFLNSDRYLCLQYICTVDVDIQLFVLFLVTIFVCWFSFLLEILLISHF